MPRVSRRDFLSYCTTSAVCLVSGGGNQDPRAAGLRLPPVRAITRGPRFHWFGYYDKLEFDPTGRYCLAMEVDFEHRSPRPDDSIRVGMVDLENGDEWIELGSSRAWCWQQGCMLQWLPGSASEVLWNDRAGDRFVCHLLDVKTREKRTLDSPIYTVSPDGRTAMTLDFARVQDMRPGYGYAGVADAQADEGAPASAGIYRLDLQSGRRELAVSLADVAKDVPLAGAKHYFNHLLFGPDGARFVFLHRWRRKGVRGFRTRMLTATPDGKDVRVVDPSGHTSHFIWRDARFVLAWSRVGERSAFWLFDERCEQEPVLVGEGVMTKNGHCSYLPGNEWILNDTYPDRQRKQHPYLYHVETGRRVALGHFLSPEKYRGEWRCDTHPRFSPDGKRVAIDSPHGGGGGRQVWLIDVAGIVG